MIEKFRTLDVNIQSAFIASLSTIVYIIIKDIVIFNMRRKKEKKESAYNIYRKYSKPLIISIERLLWRMKEIINDGETILRYHESTNEYYRYKYLSTIYRFYSVLGWLRLARRDLTFQKVSRRKKMKRIEAAISKFKSSIADGQEIEIKRLENIVKYLKIKDLHVDEITFKKASGKLEHLLLQECNKSINKIVDKEKFIRSIKIILNSLGIELKVIDEDDFIQNLFLIEGWIYRDWQDAIGDMMLVQSYSNENDYEIISYKSFEELYIKHKKEQDNIWLRRGERFFENLSISNNREVDCRVEQLLNITRATIDLFEALIDINIGGKIVEKTTIEMFKNFKEHIRS